MRKYKIYVLRDPSTQEIRYVGATCQSLGHRLSNHLYYAKIRNSTYLHNWIGTILKSGQKPLIEIIEETDAQNWESREKYWISYYKPLVSLTNQREGGSGIVIDRTSTSKERSSKAHECPVVQLDLTGRFICEHSSVIKASISTGIGRSNIHNCLCKLSGSAGGYRWIKLSKYETGDLTSIRIPSGHIGKQIKRENLETGEIKIYPTMILAQKANNLSRERLKFAIEKFKLICIFKFSYI